MKRCIAALFGILALIVLPSCIAIGAGTDKHEPTMGQELIDLKTALDRGAITQAEYDREKSAILSKSRS